MAIRPRHRRGALLLVCLVLLVLFLLLGITFVLTATSFRKGARATMRAKQFDQPLDTVNVLDTVLMEFLRGSSNPRSPFISQNLLGDMYGEPSLKGQFIVGAYTGGGQFMHLQVKFDVGFTPRNVPGYYEGQVLSMVSGPAANQSRRIVDYVPGSTTAEFVVMAFSDVPVAGNRFVINGRAFSGTGNGYLPYHPTGQIPDTALVESGGSFDETDPKYAGVGGYKAYHSLYPNSTYFEPTLGVPVAPDHDTEYLTPTGVGGQNEDYDAADSNNPWLAIVTDRGIKPSFHDPALLQHWLGWATQYDREHAVPAADAVEYNIDKSRFEQIYRRISFRPIRGDHPAFTGSNPDYVADTDHTDFDTDPTTAYEWWRDGPWDVDNDGDGTPDSIWMDIGLPVQTLKDGRVVKPLVAMLVRDMDGRVNINTAGTLALADATPTVSDDRLAGGVGSANFARGSGYGPAEIDLRWVLTEFNSDGTLKAPVTDSDVRQLFEDLLLGSTSAGIGNRESFFGRYAETEGGNVGPGESGVNDIPGRIWAAQVWGGPYAFATNPHDVLGLGVVATDQRGNPLRGFMGGPTDTAMFVDDPYEMFLGNLAMSNTYDKPFSYEEYERVMRALDVDNGTLERRLVSLGGDVLVHNRDLLTPDSWSLPVCSPGVSFNGDRNTSLRERLRLAHESDPSVPVYPQHITDVFLARVLQEGGSSDVVNQLIAEHCIAPEMMAGLRFNVNRLFGDGRDNNGNGIVDEVDEIGTELLYGSSSNAGSIAADAQSPQAVTARRHPFDNIPLDFDPTEEIPTDAMERQDDIDHYRGDFAVRQNYAKQLYCLLMAVADREGVIEAYEDNIKFKDSTPDAIKQVALEIFARRVAQFAINVVDFRDPDAIMTPFSYDPNPFDGWTENTDPHYVVWGCETPVAMLSESLALEVQRLTDEGADAARSSDIQDKTNAGSGSEFALREDEDSTDDDEVPYDLQMQHPQPDGQPWEGYPDQNGIPISSLFLEVLCTASPDRDYYPPELFKATGTDIVTGKPIYSLDLGAMDDGGNGSNPVWRIAISKPHVPIREQDDNVTPRDDDKPWLDTSMAGLMANPKYRDRIVIAPSGDPADPTPGYIGIPKTPSNNDEIEIELERYVWFTANGTPASNRFVNKYRNPEDPNDHDDPNTRLLPGQYVVLGPREFTVISQNSDKDETTNRQLIRLNPFYRDKNKDNVDDPKIHVTNGDGTSDYPTESMTLSTLLKRIRPPKAIICQAALPTEPAGWTGVDEDGDGIDDIGISGLNVSAPMGKFYPHDFTVAQDAGPPMQTVEPSSIEHDDLDDDDPTPVPEHFKDGYKCRLKFNEITQSDGTKAAGDVPLAVPFYAESNLYSQEYPDAPSNADFPMAQLFKMHLQTKGLGDDRPQHEYTGDDGIVYNYRTAFLQRLANPLRPYHALTNPYITVDWITIDLSIYSRDGTITPRPNPGGGELFVAESPKDLSEHFRSRERGVTASYDTTNPDRHARSLWHHLHLEPQGNSAPGNTNFPHDLVHSLGFLNRTFLRESGGGRDETKSIHEAGDNDVEWFSDTVKGDPATPFPWIVWNDRPFVSQYELMQVPASPPGLLGYDFSDGYTSFLNAKGNKITDGKFVNNHYAAFVSSAADEGPGIAFNHLLNFFQSASEGGGGQSGEGVKLGAVFDYLHVPSLYANSNTVLNPKDFTGQDGDDPWTGTVENNNILYSDKLDFRPPFNYISNYREPGRINLNTIYDPRVWWALMHGRRVGDYDPVSPYGGPDSYRHPALNGTRGALLDAMRHPGPSWEDFVRHRRGYGAASGLQYDPLALQGRRTPATYYPYTSPTYIGMPYRSEANWDLNPFIGVMSHEAHPADPVYTAADATLLRRQIENADMTMLDQSGNPDIQRAKYPLFRDRGPAASEPARPFADGNQDSYFKYQPINRLGNLTTTQSNVYSIWITVGYFEVTTAPQWTGTSAINDFIYPDGYQLGREVGEETGEITRHRAFYVVDRSIPVAYENGQDYNVEDVIKLRRKIE